MSGTRPGRLLESDGQPNDALGAGAPKLAVRDDMEQIEAGIRGGDLSGVANGLLANARVIQR